MAFTTLAPPLPTGPLGLLGLVTGPSAADDVQAGVQEGADATAAAFGIEGGTFLAVVGAFLAAGLAAAVLFRLARLALFRRELLRERAARLTVPVSLAVAFGAARVALAVMADQQEWYRGAAFALLLGFVTAAAWTAWRLVGAVEGGVLARYREAGVNDRRERKIRTQTILLRRILNAVIVVVAVAVLLLSVPEVRSLGTGLLASAGLLSVVAGLAVQSTLTNVIAGVQLAFTDSIRVGDVVDMQGVFGTVEEITLSNVVVKLWDGRRMVYPSSHFTTQPFENWTRVGSAVSGVVEMDVDWRVPMDALRDRLTALLESTDLWDGEENAMQVTDAVGGMVRVRAVVSARTSGELWDLRCLVREDLVAFLRAEHPEGIHTQRMVEVPVGRGAAPAPGADGDHHDDAAAPAPAPAEPAPPATAPLPRVEAPTTAPLTQTGEHGGIYTGSIRAVRRARELAGPGEDAYAERRARQEQQEQQGEPAAGGGSHAARPDQAVDER